MHDVVQDYYGKVLAASEDLQTNACKTDARMVPHIKQALGRVHDDVLSRYYGCGLVYPEKLEGLTILDLGCGAGRDVYLLSQLVGPTGRVIGVDMTDEQLAVARTHIDWHAERFEHAAPNVEFHKGYIERLDELGLEPGSVDVIVSNCVINLSPDKQAVLRGAYDLLKPGGELYFADVYADRRVSEDLVADPVLYGECLSGALYWNDFLNLATAAGFRDPRLVTDRRLTIENDDVEARIGHVGFFSATYRLFKLDALETHCEDYGQAVVYQGGIAHHEEVFELDAHHRIEKGRTFPVCGNTWRMLHDTRFREHFTFVGDFDRHFGIFEGCGTAMPFGSAGAGEASDASGGCC
ncbi:MAG: methyltransferase domain-containing protein [Planctomycetota bacterium]|nr:methyltransferase domain-containing protein [Planctomycetota bacterium]